MSEKKISKRNDEIEYKDEHKHERFVSNKNFIHDVSILNPLSISYKSYWKELKRRCIEGYWFEGKWMPGNLYFYINFCKIELKENAEAKTARVARPFLRDLEWEKAYVFAEARGFSGFSEDEEYTCHALVDNIAKKPELAELYKLPKECYKPDGTLKTYIHPRTYLRKIHSKNLGKPLYQSESHNVIDIECRRSGKSFWGANGIILHNFLMDGSYDYDAYLQALSSGNPFNTETLVGAIDSRYSLGLLNKSQISIDNLVGSQTFQGSFYPSPLSKSFMGSWTSGRCFIEAKIDKQIGGKWQRIGSGSKIYHRTFNDNPQAGNGISASVTCLEEVGFMGNLIDALGALKDITYNGPFKFGTIYCFGTGGQMESGASEAAKEVFNNPKEYDCLCFDDIWEETGSIGFFVPYELGLNEFKNEEGITDLTKATKYVDMRREQLIKGKSKRPLYDEMQNNPRVPSEAFLMLNANIFPIGELKEHLQWVKSMQQDSFIKGQCGELIFVQNEGGEQAKVEWRPDVSNKLTPCGYRMKKTDDTQGCIQIWEHPQYVNGVIPSGLYLAGSDPYDQDQSTTSSLGSTFIYKTFLDANGLCEIPVAEYTARPRTAEEHHENVRKLLMYYNAIDLYENERNSLKMHFSHKHSLYLLAKTPSILKATEGSKVERTFGIHMTEGIKDEIEIYTRDWLLQDAGNGRLNLHKIYSIPLLEELINYNRIGNFDRVIAYMLVICNRLSNYNMKVSSIQDSKIIEDAFLKRAITGGFFN